MNSLRLEPISSVAGVVNLPGSKSVSNRALLLAALARGTTRLTNLLDSDDIRHMLAALTQLGVKYKLSADKTECIVHGLGRSFAVSAPVTLAVHALSREVVSKVKRSTGTGVDTHQ